MAEQDRDGADAPTETTGRTETMSTDGSHAGTTPYTDTAYTGTPYTDSPYTGTTDVLTTPDTAPPARRRGPDPLALLVGLATLAMAVFAFVGELPDLSGVDPRWLLAGGAAVVGLVLLVGSLRSRSGGRRG